MKIDRFFEGNCDVTDIPYGFFDSFLMNHDLVLVMFYNPYHEPCKKMESHFATAAQVTDRPDTAFAAVNCIMSRQLCLKEGALELPMFKAYTKGHWAVIFSDKYVTGQSLARFAEGIPVPMGSSTPKPRMRFY